MTMMQKVAIILLQNHESKCQNWGFEGSSTLLSQTKEVKTEQGWACTHRGKVI